MVSRQPSDTMATPAFSRRSSGLHPPLVGARPGRRKRSFALSACTTLCKVRLWQ
jgi:hypothetical protein